MARPRAHPTYISARSAANDASASGPRACPVERRCTKTSVGASFAIPASARSSTYSRLARSRTSSVFARPSGLTLRSTLAPSLRLSVLQRRADRGTRPWRGSRSDRRAPRSRARPSRTVRGPSGSAAPPRPRQPARARRAHEPDRGFVSSGGAGDGAKLELGRSAVSRTPTSSASGSTNVTSISVSIRRGHEEELISVGHLCSTIAARAGRAGIAPSLA